MTIRRFLLISVIAMLVIGSSGCKLPASTPPTTPTPQGGFPVPGGTNDMGMFEKFATQTSQAATAQAGGGQPAVSTNTPEPQAETPITQPTQQANKTPKPTKTQVVVPTATPGLPATYTLQKGEFPYCIARRFNLNPNDLLRANNLGQNSTTYPGLKLTIPKNAGNFPGNRSLHKHPATYSVKSGDTIYTIGCYFGDVDPNAIVIANGLKEPYKLTAGESIQIP